MIKTQVYVLLIGILIYLLLAILHHRHDKSLTLPIFMEYLLTAVLSIVLLLGTIYQ